MSDYTMPEKASFEPCPDSWARSHVFYSPELNKSFPARCGRWNCLSCAKLNYYKVDKLAAAGNPERFITLTRAGRTPRQIRFNLQHLIQALRRRGLKFEYFAVIELHKNGQAHIHLFQRGDFIPQAELSELWEKCTAKSYAGKGSSIVDIRFIQDNQNAQGYLLKYIKKTLDQEKHNSGSWMRLQELYPGLNHYRMSRNWLATAPEKPVDGPEWFLMPRTMPEYQDRPVDPIEELFYTDTLDPLNPSQERTIRVRRSLAEIRHKNKLSSVPPARPGRTQSKI